MELSEETRSNILQSSDNLHLMETHTNLQHVKQLTLSLENEEQFENFFMNNLQTPNLEVLELRLPFEEEEEVSSFYDIFRILAERYPKVNKFTLKLVGFNVSPTNYMKEMFVIDCSRRGYLVLFRK